MSEQDTTGGAAVRVVLMVVYDGGGPARCYLLQLAQQEAEEGRMGGAEDH